jgi:aryl-alcohol dehydrogenase-like predicted oxidoreductase
MTMTTNLPVQQFGTTDMHITRVGFGSWAVGGDWAVGWGNQDDQESIDAIRHAVQRGVNWIDTAAIYGLGHSEEIVGAALAHLSQDERPYVFTKCGLIGDPQSRNATPQQIGAAASLRRELEASLRRLKVERIDLYQMHWPAKDGTPIEEYWQTLLDLKKEGKVRAVGLSNHNVAQLEAANRIGHVDTLQPPFSAIKRTVAEAELPWCAAHRTGVIVYSPMQAGLLSGSFSEARAVARRCRANDWRSRNNDFQGVKR